MSSTLQRMHVNMHRKRKSRDYVKGMVLARFKRQSCSGVLEHEGCWTLRKEGYVPPEVRDAPQLQLAICRFTRASSRRSCSASPVVSSLTIALLPIRFARCAKRSVLWVSVMLRVLGEMLAIITVLEFPPRESCEKMLRGKMEYTQAHIAWTEGV